MTAGDLSKPVTRLLLLLALVCLISAVFPIYRLCLSVHRTALRSASFWLVLASTVWVLTAGMGVLEPIPGSWLWLGHFRLLAAVSVLWPLVAVMGARWPGASVWNWIVLSLLVVFALPILEQWIIGRTMEDQRVGMDGPRFVFFWMVAGVGIANYLPTRFGLAAFLFACGVLSQALAVGPWTMAVIPQAGLSGLAGILVSGSAWMAFLRRGRRQIPGSEGAWLEFRDCWGLVWAARLRDRWNATARYYDWPIRLTWGGIRTMQPGTSMSEAQTTQSTQQFRLLLRRFADPDKFISGEE